MTPGRRACARTWAARGRWRKIPEGKAPTQPSAGLDAKDATTLAWATPETVAPLAIGEVLPSVEFQQGDAATCLANRAACWLKLERYEDAARDCDEAIAIDGTYAKAYARRARAREALGDEEGALEDWERTRALAPRDATARDETRRLKPVVERKREEMKREMLDKMKDLGNSLLGNFGLSLDNFKAEKDATTGSYSIQFVNEKKRSTTGDEDDEDDEN